MSISSLVFSLLRDLDDGGLIKYLPEDAERIGWRSAGAVSLFASAVTGDFLAGTAVPGPASLGSCCDFLPGWRLPLQGLDTELGSLGRQQQQTSKRPPKEV